MKRKLILISKNNFKHFYAKCFIISSFWHISFFISFPILMVLIVEYLSNATFKKKFLVILKHSRTRSLDYIIILYFFWVVTKNEDGKGEWTTDPFKQFLHFRVARVMNHKIFCIRIVFAIIYSLLIATKYVTSQYKEFVLMKIFCGWKTILFLRYVPLYWFIIQP